MIHENWEQLQENLNAKKLAIGIIDILVFKGHINKMEGDKIISSAIDIVQNKESGTI